MQSNNRNMQAGFKAIWRYRLRKLLGIRHIDVSQIAYEKAEQIFYISHLESGMTAFDVGANVGELSLLFSRFVGRTGVVHSFEASKNTFRRLTSVIESAGRANIILNNIGIAERGGTRVFYDYGDTHSGWSSLANRPLERYGIDVKPERQDEITVISIDEYCLDKGIERIDLLKIDIEGAEYQALLGAARMFKEKRIGACVFETGQTTTDMGNTYDAVFALMHNYGYKICSPLPGIGLKKHIALMHTGAFTMHIAKPV